MEFDEFCAATLSVHQLEALDRWEQHARCAYELFEKDGNRAIVIEELASVCWVIFMSIYIYIHLVVGKGFSLVQVCFKLAWEINKECPMDRVKPKIKAQINGVHPVVELHNTNDLNVCSNQS